jgi:clan AA aspartic protease (TIGR02281 family)
MGGFVKTAGAVVASAVMLGVAIPANADDVGNFFGSVVGGIIGQSMQQQRAPQPVYPQPQYYQPQPDAAAAAEAHRQYLARQAEIKRQKQLQQQQDAARAQVPAATASASNTTAGSATGSLDVAMKKKDGNLWVPAQINNVVTIDFVIDSGASDITLPRDVYLTLIRSGTLTKANYIGDVKFGIADGSEVKGVKFKLASLQVGNQVLTDVVASVMPSDTATPLLGLSFLSRFQSWAIDNNSGTLKLTPLNADPAKASAQVATTSPQTLPDLTAIPAPSAAGASPAPSTSPAAATPTVTPAPLPDLKLATNAPRSGSAPSSALIVKEAAAPGTADAAPPAPTPETASALPNFPANTAYADARSSLLALGYGPAPVPDGGKCDANTDTTCFPERVACTRTDSVHCDFFWRRGDQVIKVKTVAVPPSVSSVECQVNCK